MSDLQLSCLYLFLDIQGMMREVKIGAIYAMAFDPEPKFNQIDRS